MNKVVARFSDGRVVKGTTADFAAGREVFHITDPSSEDGWGRTAVSVGDLKALFYVKDFAGDPARVDSQLLDCPPPPGEKAVEVIFQDGELIVGTTPSYRVTGEGFFLVPVDRESNNERCYVPASATRFVSTIC